MALPDSLPRPLSFLLLRAQCVRLRLVSTQASRPGVVSFHSFLLRALLQEPPSFDVDRPRCSELHRDAPPRFLACPSSLRVLRRGFRTQP